MGLRIGHVDRVQHHLVQVPEHLLTIPTGRRVTDLRPRQRRHRHGARAPARTSATPYTSVRSTAGSVGWHGTSAATTGHRWCAAQFYWCTCVLSAAPAPSWTAARRGRVEVWPGPCGFGWHKPFGSHERCRADNAAAEGLLRRLRLYIHRTVWRRGVTPTLGRITLRNNILPMIIGNAGEHEGIELEQGMSRTVVPQRIFMRQADRSRSAWPQEPAAGAGRP